MSRPRARVSSSFSKVDELENYNVHCHLFLLISFFQALVLRQKGSLMDLVDPKLGSNFNKEEAMRMTKVALVCTNPSPALRPTMSAVVSMLEGKLGLEGLVNDPRIYGDDFRFIALREKYDELQLQSSTEAETLMDHTGTGSSSTSAQDLYPRSLNSL